MKELEEMKAEAEKAGIEVLMGYNKVSCDAVSACHDIYLSLFQHGRISH